MERAASEIEIAVEDEGVPFDPTTASLPTVPRALDEAVPAGRGLRLVRSVAPRLSYERRGGANRVTIAFPLEAPPES